MATDVPNLLRDTGGEALQAISPLTSVTATLSASSQRLTLPTDTYVVRIAATNNCYIRFGTSAVDAASTDMLFPIGCEVFNISSRAITHVAVIGLDGSGGAFSATKVV